MSSHEPILDYANKEVDSLFESFDNPEDRDWAWMVLNELREAFPHADHYTTAANEIIIGKKPKGNHNGAPVFYFYKNKKINGNDACLWASHYNKQKIGIIPKEMKRHVQRTEEDFDAFRSWLSAIKKNVINNNFEKHFDGSRLTPKDYPNSEPSQAEQDSEKPIIMSDNSKSKIPLNTILYGPPGTGKTYKTINESVKIIDPDFFYKIEKDKEKSEKEKRRELKERYDFLCCEEKIVMTTFHQSFSYEDFVEGIRADTNDGSLVYSVEPGILRKIVDAASAKKESISQDNSNYVLIIDEINRGNISNIFGELITLIEDSKRKGATDGEGLSINLPYSKKPFSIPDNLYLIGTMNTADRSLTQIDTALRRRFHFKEMMPEPGLLRDTEVEGVNLYELLTCLNERIKVLYDREHTLGHAFFIHLTSESEISALRAVFENKIFPLLQEYFFEDWKKIQLILGNDLVTEQQFDPQLFNQTVEELTDTKSYSFNSDILDAPQTYINIYNQEAGTE